MSTFMAALAAARVARAEKAKLKASLHRTVTRQGSTASGTTPRAESQGWPVGAANRPLLTRLAHATWPAEASTRSAKATGNHEESSSSSSHRSPRGRPSTQVPSIRASRLWRRMQLRQASLGGRHRTVADSPRPDLRERQELAGTACSRPTRAAATQSGRAERPVGANASSISGAVRGQQQRRLIPRPSADPGRRSSLTEPPWSKATGRWVLR